MPILSSFFRPTQRNYPLPPLNTRLVGERVLLRVGELNDWQSWSAVREASRNFLAPWEPAWPLHALSPEFFSATLRRHWREWRQGSGYAFQIMRREQSGVIGGIALNDVARGIGQKASLGYWIGQDYTGQGLMTEAAQLAIDFAFNRLKLNRVEAGCLPHNLPSKRLLQRLGFTEEGYAKAYLRINGRFEDHLLWGLVRPQS